MRVVLVGAAAARERLRTPLRSAGIDVVGEALTIDAAQALASGADAFLVASDGHPGEWDEPPGPEGLTPREIQVLELVAEGLPNKAIAARLAISDQTVKFHVSSIYGKLGAANRTDAVRRAVRSGLITL
jgi:DNA-binding NarL/FixJ family response regulator